LLTHLTDALTTLITHLYATTGLAGILLAMSLESFCIPLPSEIILPLAGIMLVQGNLLPGMNHFVALLLIALAGASGDLLGSIVAYWVGYSGGRPLMLKIGRYLLISQHDSDVADRFFQKYGSATAFFSRLLPVVRTYISLPAGISKMPFGKFCLFTILGVFPWALLLTYIGTVIGNNLGILSPIFHSLDVVILIGLALLIVLYLWRHIRNDRKARAAHAAAAAMSAAAQPQQPWGQQQAPFQPPQQLQQTVQQGWGQQPAQFQPMPPQPAQPQFQPTPGQNWTPPQPGWSQMPPQPGSENHTMRRN
jgi:membrane protein DedA with SNARE-associated domain